MNEADCWRIIERARKKFPNSASLVADLVASKLNSLDAEACIDFHNFLWDRAAQAYHWDLWAAAYIIDGGCSDDNFLYFLGWLIANGRTRYYAALANAEVLADWEFDADHITCERMLSVGADAYEAIAGQSIPRDRQTTSWPSEPLGKPWNDEDLPKRFPKLARKFAS